MRPSSSGLVGVAPLRDPRGGAGGRRRWRTFVRRTALWVALLPHVASGCYTYSSIRGAADPGTRVVLDINDQGRVSLGPRLGTELARVEGDLVRKLDTAYVLRLTQVQRLDGATVPWAGETVSLRDEFVKTVGERKLSRGRTLFAVAGFVAAVGLVVAAQSLIGKGSGDTRDGGPGPGPDM